MSALRPVSRKHKLHNVHPVGINPGKYATFNSIFSSIKKSTKVILSLRTGHDAYLQRYSRQTFMNLMKRLSLRKRLLKSAHIQSIAGNTVTPRPSKPSFQWAD